MKNKPPRSSHPLLASIPFWVSLTSLACLLVYCCAQALEWDPLSGNLIAHSYSVWGDWSAHFTFISNLLERGPHWLGGENPLFSGTLFQYPFFSHVLTAIFAWVFQLSVPYATYSSSLILVFVLPFALHRFFTACGLKRWTSLTAILIFLLIGGMQCFDSSLKETEPLTNQFSSGSVFTQFLVFELFPQRAFLFGIILFSFLASFLLKRFHRCDPLRPLPFLLLTLGLGITPLLHLHTYLAIVVFLLCLFIFPLPAPSPQASLRFRTFQIGLTTALLSFVCIYFLLFRGANSFQGNWDLWYPGWAQNPKANLKGAMDMNPLSFWFYNTGFFLPLTLYGLYLLRKNKAFYFLGASGIFIFILALFINIQPYFYDNLKLFTYSFLFLAPFAAHALAHLFERNIFLKSLSILLLALQCSSGILDLHALTTQKQTAIFFSREEQELATEFKSIRKSANDLVLIAPRHNHWVPCLSGNPVAMGYAGWLWSWGIQYQFREQEIQKIFTGQAEAASLVRSLGIHYIVVNQNDSIGANAINFHFLKSQYPVLLERNGWTILSTQ